IVSSSTGNIKTEIVLLAESQKEKASLLAYFTKHKDQQSFSDFGNFDADEDKLKYLRAS
ncbi:23238_t:CDS:1, partial [Rhizophagus irregularis]